MATELFTGHGEISGGRNDTLVLTLDLVSHWNVMKIARTYTMHLLDHIATGNHRHINKQTHIHVKDNFHICSKHTYWMGMLISIYSNRQY